MTTTTPLHPLSRCLARAGRAVIVGLAAAGALLLSAATVSAATITVTTSADEFDNTPNATCSLREAIQSANHDADFGGCTGAGAYGGDTIIFDAGVTTAQLTQTTGSDNDDNSFLDLDIDIGGSQVLTIDGGTSGVTVQPGVSPWDDRIFDIVYTTTTPGAVLLRNLTIQGGLQGSTGPSHETSSGICDSGGGGVRNWSGGELTLEATVVQSNTMTQRGGGVCQDGGTLHVISSTIQSNAAISDSGGGLYVSATVSITGTQIVSNTAYNNGGGAYISGTALITGTHIGSNKVITGAGGGAYVTAGAVSITGTQVVSNAASWGGGGIYIASAAYITGTQIVSNATASTGGGGGVFNAAGATVSITGTHIQSNTAGWGDGQQQRRRGAQRRRCRLHHRDAHPEQRR